MHRAARNWEISIAPAERDIAQWAVDGMTDEVDAPALTGNVLAFSNRESVEDFLYRVAVQLEEMDAPDADVKIGRALAVKIFRKTGVETARDSSLRAGLTELHEKRRHRN